MSPEMPDAIKLFVQSNGKFSYLPTRQSKVAQALATSESM